MKVGASFLICIAFSNMDVFADVKFPLNHRELREYVTRAVRRDQLPVRPVKITYLPNARAPRDLDYCLGGLDRSVFKTGNHILDNIIEAQAICESISQFVRANPTRHNSRARFWGQHIVRANKIIAVACEKTYANNRKALQASDQLLEDVYGVFIDALENYRRVNYGIGNQNIPPQINGRPRPCSAPELLVFFERKPRNLTVSYIPAGPWELYQWMVARNKKAQKPTWNEIGGSAIPNMFGRYYFKASDLLNNKETVTKNPIRVTNNSKIVCTSSRITAHSRRN